mmetsp:Transcript_27038/g.66965  ORF Transcript_27038/g.66965 Transcript_27038/m.66965 type:complete len:208 (+) Transcript_27038:594-1217(+)
MDGAAAAATRSSSAARCSASGLLPSVISSGFTSCSCCPLSSPSGHTAMVGSSATPIDRASLAAAVSVCSPPSTRIAPIVSTPCSSDARCLARSESPIARAEKITALERCRPRSCSASRATRRAEAEAHEGLRKRTIDCSDAVNCCTRWRESGSTRLTHSYMFSAAIAPLYDCTSIVPSLSGVMSTRAGTLHSMKKAFVRQRTNERKR